MNLKTWLPLCLAIVLGLVAAKVARDMIQKNRGANTTGNLVQVVVAKRAIGAGELLTDENCQLGNVGSDTVPDSSFRAITDLKDRVAQVSLGKGQALTENLLAPLGTGAGLQAVIPNGMRAISIEVNEFSGVGGMLLPGCHVDVLATVAGENGGEMVSRTVVQNVSVTAVGQRMVLQPKKEGDEPVVFRSVTLLATPAESEAIELAASSGRPRLVLRNNTDKAINNTPGVTASNLRGSRATVAPPQPPTPQPVEQVTTAVEKPEVVVPTFEPTFRIIKVIRGTNESEVRFDGGWFDQSAKATNTDTKAVSTSDTTPAAGGH